MANPACMTVLDAWEAASGEEMTIIKRRGVRVDFGLYYRVLDEAAKREEHEDATNFSWWFVF